MLATSRLATRPIGRAATAALVLAAVCAGTYAQEDAEAAKIDPKADEIIKKMVQHYQDVQSVSCDINLAVSMSLGDAKQDMTSVVGFAAVRPNQFAMRLKEGMMGATVVSDGEHLYTFVPMMGNYTKVEAPQDFTGLFEEAGMATNMTGTGEGQLLLGLLAEGGYENVMQDVSELSYVGEETIDEQATNHVKLHRDEVDMDVWVAAGESPWIVRIVPDVQKAMQVAAEENPNSPYGDMEMDMNISFEGWSTEGLPAETFAFNPPESAKEVDSLFEMGEMTLEEAPAREDPADALVDKPAPNFTVDVHGSDEQFTLADHKGEHIVVLDFWATWCPPCVKGLPIIDKVTEQFADRNVVFYAVDLRESDEDVKRFLTSHDLSFNVAMDREGTVADLYKVGGIPQTVIISKEGIVEAVHVGLLPNLEQKLTEELETLIAEGKL